MPDALSAKLSSKEGGKGSLLRANLTVTQDRPAKSNDPRSAALSGATLAFAARAERLSAGAASGKPLDTKGDGARNAAILAHAERGRVMDKQLRQQQQEESSALSVKERIKHFSSEPAPAAVSLSPRRQPSSQQVAAQLAVDRSTAHAASKPSRKPADATRDQNPDGGSPIKSPPLDRRPTVHLASPSNYEDGQQSTISARMQPKDSASSREDTNQRRLPRASTDETSEEVDIKPRLPPRTAAASPRSVSDLLTTAVLAKDSSLEPRAGVASRPPLSPSPLRQSQSIIGHAGREVSAYALSDARVASSLASSRASSPPKHSTPPPPPRHRLSRSKSLLRIAASNGGDRSRTPSPAKSSLRQTMRTESKSNNEGERTKSNHHRILRTHPHKYQEGERKRWQERVTEAQRKRYEGVWAANKGLLLDESQADKVVNVVVREIWSRSRLPQPLLAQIWDLVSQDGEPMVLSREQFVVGMWLIDQSLQGRKLPWKVAESAWDSVRRFQSRPQQST